MKIFFFMLGMAIGFPLSAAASERDLVHHDANKPGVTDPSQFAGNWQTTVTRSGSSKAHRTRPHAIGKRKTNIATLRAKAIRISMKYLPRLRPYASNYPRMVSVVRAYWRKNAANPNAARLTNMIMQHVQEKYRFFVRPKLRTGVSKGIKVLKSKLHNS